MAKGAVYTDENSVLCMLRFLPAAVFMTLKLVGGVPWVARGYVNTSYELTVRSLRSLPAASKLTAVHPLKVVTSWVLLCVD